MLQPPGRVVQRLMRTTSLVRVVCATATAALALGACRPGAGPVTTTAPVAAPSPGRELPELPVIDLADRVPARDSVRAATGDTSSARRITITSANADVRTLLLAIAREAGISLVVSDDVRRRVSVSLTDALPEEAIAAIIAQAGLTIARPATPAFPPVVYYQLLVNVDQAPAEAIARRFGVSLELARFIVESRTQTP